MPCCSEAFVCDIEPVVHVGDNSAASFGYLELVRVEGVVVVVEPQREFAGGCDAAFVDAVAFCSGRRLDADAESDIAVVADQDIVGIVVVLVAACEERQRQHSGQQKSDLFHKRLWVICFVFNDFFMILF